MFNAERQVANDRMMRSGIIGLGFVGLTLLFFGLALVGASSTPSTETPTRTPARTATVRPVTTPGPVGTPTLAPGTPLPTVQPPPAATKTPTPAPTATTPGTGRKTAIVTGTADAGGLALRQTPRGELIDRLPDGTVVELLGETQAIAGDEWQKVRDPRGREGWVAGQYLIINP